METEAFLAYAPRWKKENTSLPMKNPFQAGIGFGKTTRRLTQPAQGTGPLPHN